MKKLANNAANPEESANELQRELTGFDVSGINQNHNCREVLLEGRWDVLWRRSARKLGRCDG